jgi:hypothetical protein
MNVLSGGYLLDFNLSHLSLGRSYLTISKNLILVYLLRIRFRKISLGRYKILMSVLPSGYLLEFHITHLSLGRSYLTISTNLILVYLQRIRFRKISLGRYKILMSVLPSGYLLDFHITRLSLGRSHLPLATNLRCHRYFRSFISLLLNS